MRHRVHGRKLGRTSAHRKALFRNQLTALFTHERIITTVAKAKELRPIAERMVTIARTGTLSARRKVATMVPDKEIARRLFEEIAPRFADRPGGYTRIMRLGRRRGDNAELAIIEFIDYDLADHVDSGDEGDGKGSFMDRAKGVFGGGTAAEAADATAEEGAEAVADEVAVEVADEPVEAAAEVDEPVAEAVAEEATDPEPEEVVEEAADEPAEVAAPVEDDASEDAEAEPAEASDDVADSEEEKKDD